MYICFIIITCCPYLNSLRLTSACLVPVVVAVRRADDLRMHGSRKKGRTRKGTKCKHDDGGEAHSTSTLEGRYVEKRFDLNKATLHSDAKPCVHNHQHSGTFNESSSPGGTYAMSASYGRALADIDKR